MRLAEITDRTLDTLDLSRAEARAVARRGRLWASSRVDLAIAPDEAEAKWALETGRVERVVCSTMPEDLLWDVRRRVREVMSSRRRWLRWYGRDDV